MTRNDLLIIAIDGSLTEVSLKEQATTDIIAGYVRPLIDKFVIQMVGDYFEVYPVNTLRPHLGGYTIGMPKFSHKDEDRAVAWAIGEAWSEV